MRPWFHSAERCQALWAEQQRWLGTPFFPHAESLGHGVDCVRLQHANFSAIGAIPRLELPDYSLDHAKHTTRTVLLQFLLTNPSLQGRFVMVPPAGPRLTGDLLGLKSGRVDHHLAACNPWGEVVHAIETDGVIRTKLDDKHIVARTLYVLRLMEVEA
jgi:hypothetical protein